MVRYDLYRLEATEDKDKQNSESKEDACRCPCASADYSRNCSENERDDLTGEDTSSDTGKGRVIRSSSAVLYSHALQPMSCVDSRL